MGLLDPRLRGNTAPDATPEEQNFVLRLLGIGGATPGTGNNLAVSPLAAPASQPAAPSVASQIPKPPDKFTAHLSNGEVVNGPDFQAWMEQHRTNPNAAEILKLTASGEQIKKMREFYANNALPQEARINGGPMPTRDQVSVPEKQQAQLNPLAVLLGLATGLGGQYGNPAQAVANQIAAGQQQTQQNFQNDMTRYQSLVDNAANKYHDEMTARNEAIKEQAMNNAIDTANAERSYKNREGLAKMDAQQLGADTLSRGLTTQGQQQIDQDIVAAAEKRRAEALPEYLANMKTATGIDLNAAQAAQHQAQTQSILTSTQDEHALQGGKIAEQQGRVAHLAAQTEASKQTTDANRKLLPGELQAQADRHAATMADVNLKKAQADYYKQGGARARDAGMVKASDIMAALRSNDQQLKDSAGELRQAWGEYNNAEFGPQGRLAYIKAQRDLAAKNQGNGPGFKTVGGGVKSQQVYNAYNDPVYLGLEQHSKQVADQLHAIDRQFHDVKSQTAAARDRIMKSSRVPGASAPAANWSAAY